MEAALGRIMDVDIAAETTNLAKATNPCAGVCLYGCPGKLRQPGSPHAPSINKKHEKFNL